MLTRLTEIYQQWCEQNQLPHIDALELRLSDGLSAEQLQWLTRFNTVWEHFER